MGQDRRFRAAFKAIGQPLRQRILAPPSRALTTAPALKKDGAQAIDRSRRGLTTKIHALGNPVEVTLSTGQDRHLACAEP